MKRLRRGERVVIATHNPGKVREIGALLAPLGLRVVSAGELGLPEPEENAETFAGNALLKARAAASATGLPALADDSGLCVDALSGAPGVHSARWAGPERDFAQAMRLVEEKLRAAGALTPESRRARFVCALALVRPEAGQDVFEGEVRGRLIWPPRGERGFGYDPVFVPEGHEETFAEMEPERKHAMSHRARAFAKFIAALSAAAGK